MTNTEKNRFLKLYSKHHEQLINLLTQILTEIKQNRY